MSESQDTTPTLVEEVSTKSGQYIVLREIESVEELAELLVDGGETGVFATIAQSVHAHNDGYAIKTVAVGEDSVATGRYVAVPMRSWRPRYVRTVVQLSLGD